jgi:hypothetical protein
MIGEQLRWTQVVALFFMIASSEIDPQTKAANFGELTHEGTYIYRAETLERSCTQRMSVSSAVDPNDPQMLFLMDP